MSKQQEMFALMRQWIRSGQSKAEFARRAGVSANVMTYWSRRYEQRQSETATASFVRVVAEEPDVPSPPSSGERVRLELPDGLVVVIY